MTKKYPDPKKERLTILPDHHTRVYPQHEPEVLAKEPDFEKNRRELIQEDKLGRKRNRPPP